MPIQVFISHSTWPKPELDQRLQDQVPTHSAFRQQLCRRLANNPAITVVVDEKIPVAHSWREFLFERIAECRAAVVLVNEQALRHSPWVDTEVKVLGYRAHNEKNDFCLILVPFGGVTSAQIAEHSAWQAVALGELQMLPRAGLDEADDDAVDDVIRKIESILKELPDPSEDSSPAGWLVARLCALLEKMDTDDLKEIGKSLGADTSGLVNASAVQRRVAHTLYCQGPSAVLKLNSFPKCKLDVDDFTKILEILNTYWIDMSASIGVLSCRREATRLQAIAINGKEVLYTPQAYVRQICGELEPWPVVAVDPKYDIVEQVRTHLADYFEEQLSSRLLNPEFASREETAACLNAILASKYSVPVFITFLQRGGGRVSELVAQVSEAFPNISVIVCTGTEAGKANLPPNVLMLEPEFSLAAEASALEECSGVSTHFRRKGIRK
jgi:hypothetical protein